MRKGRAGIGVTFTAARTRELATEDHVLEHEAGLVVAGAAPTGSERLRILRGQRQQARRPRLAQGLAELVDAFVPERAW